MILIKEKIINSILIVAIIFLSMTLFNIFKEREITNNYKNVTLQKFKKRRFKVVDSNKEINSEIKIHISGAVRNPGFYHIIPGTKLKRIIEELVILREDAEITNLNLNKKLYKNDKIIVPRK
ncbi:MAG: hypothetical protein K9K76_00535 [Halanaerobiales bacterium]|nr:hypothetical protein [Halanaerobiales bacterium]